MTSVLYVSVCVCVREATVRVKPFFPASGGVGREGRRMGFYCDNNHTKTGGSNMFSPSWRFDNN